MSSEFKRAESSTPQFKVHQRTFRFMNQQPVYVQVIAMDNSAWIWISSAASPLFASHQQQSLQPQIQQGSGGGTGSTQAGAFGDFAMAMPSFRPGQRPQSTLLLRSTPGPVPTTRFKRQFLVNVDIPPAVDNAMLISFSEKKVVETLQEIFAEPSSESS
ncbi:hypothetical protein BGX34_000687 [Mortierella sp. NVP85]|nr:hypothetical protein BGX34_000687 [Mortierella sp. NVP85]